MPPAAPHPGNDYYVNVVTHTIQRQGNALAAAALLGSGWTGPYTWAEAKAAASGLAKASPGTVGGLPGGGGISNPLSGVNAIGDFFNRLTQPNTWVRVGEVVAGVLLVYLGLSATMRGTEVGKQTHKVVSTGKKVAKVVAK
jgi:hypothetical protein